MDEAPRRVAEANEQAVLEAIRQCVAVVGRDQMLVVRLDPGTDEEMATEVAAQLAHASNETGVSMMLVVAPQILVADLEEPVRFGELTGD